MQWIKSNTYYQRQIFENGNKTSEKNVWQKSTTSKVHELVHAHTRACVEGRQTKGTL